jgi:HSP20 family protein
MIEWWKDLSIFPQISSSMLMDIKDTPDSFEVQVDLPGVEKESITLIVRPHHRELQISANRERMKQEERQSYRLLERYVGNMTRTITIPEKADFNRISAKFNAGELQITIPKLIKNEECKIQEISID